MTYLETILLYCLKQVNGERSIYSIYHILKGKKSSQTIQDSHLFRLVAYFNSMTNLTREFYDKNVKELVEKGCIHIDGNDCASLTNIGKDKLDFYINEKFAPINMDGIKYGDHSIIFWKRISLLIQVLSNLNHRETNYFPIQRDREIQRWVKRYIRETANKKTLSEQLFKELHTIFSDCGNRNGAEIFVRKLTGYNRIGWTDRQICMHVNGDEIENRFCFLDILHLTLRVVHEQPNHFPVLSSVFQDLIETYTLTKSTKTTLYYFNKGLTIDKISAVRGLKVSTIEDHLVEIALTIKDFSIEQFISLPEVQLVTESLKQVKTKKLKPIKEIFPHLSYFQIRMVLAKNGEKL